MEELRIRPKSNYLYTANWQELYDLTKHWQSDIKFFTYEISFLKHLIDKYFIWMIKNENITHVRQLVINIEELEKDQKVISDSITKHINHIRLFLVNSFSRDEMQFRGDHVKLEEKLVRFIKSFREAKSEIFATTEEVLDNEKLQHLLQHY